MAPPAADKVVVYTTPFTRYLTWDALRLTICVLSVASVMMALTLAQFRWAEGRRSAAVYLATISALLATTAIQMIHNLGHPGNWVLWLYLICAVLAITAAILAVGEIRRGVWRR